MLSFDLSRRPEGLGMFRRKKPFGDREVTFYCLLGSGLKINLFDLLDIHLIILKVIVDSSYLVLSVGTPRRHLRTCVINSNNISRIYDKRDIHYHPG